MEYKLDIVATRQAIMKVLDTFINWCMPRNYVGCDDCPYAKTCDNLYDIRDELLRMEKEREE